MKSELNNYLSPSGARSLHSDSYFGIPVDGYQTLSRFLCNTLAICKNWSVHEDHSRYYEVGNHCNSDNSELEMT